MNTRNNKQTSRLKQGSRLVAKEIKVLRKPIIFGNTLYSFVHGFEMNFNSITKKLNKDKKF